MSERPTLRERLPRYCWTVIAVGMDTMITKKKTIGVDSVPAIKAVNFIAPRGIDFTHHNYIVMDGIY